ncbi:hypothetical protein DNTS_032242 [Danionella cerebrum]|uniref:Arginine/serine-rich coiled-coil protein 2 n=1 Tax=Danionella cerebrum TaxID=2873325 RepID=A0A553NIV7_9TELE|nr:hypothetical protein DNTS_032242 [Danionella translucida]
MAANDAELHDSLSGKSQSDEDHKVSRSGKHRSRSRSRSMERKHKSGDKRHRRSHSRSKEARKRDSEKTLKSSSGSEEPLDLERSRDRLSGDMEERHRRKNKKFPRTRSHSRSRDITIATRTREDLAHEVVNGDPEVGKRSEGASLDRTPEGSTDTGAAAKAGRKRRGWKRPGRKVTVSQLALCPSGAGTQLWMPKKPWLEAVVAMASLSETSAPSATSALNVAALLASGTQVTPQIAMAAQMAAMHAKTLAETGIAVPSYYNPSAVNPMKFAEQEKKRKMLWQGKKEGVRDKSQTAELWEKLNFGNKDQNVKFRKLMGIKGEEEAGSSAAVNDEDDEGLKTLQQQEEMFRNLDVQYEMARSQTHTQRGMGLGFFSRGMDAV